MAGDILPHVFTDAKRAIRKPKTCAHCFGVGHLSYALVAPGRRFVELWPCPHCDGTGEQR